MKDTLHYFLTPLVDHPEALSIDEQTEEQRTILVIHCHEEDMGKVIGKGGRIIRALRDLVKLVATKKGIYVDVTIAEGEKAPPTE